jgi:predicted RNA-binding protein associated with RNAse of E/G family
MSHISYYNPPEAARSSEQLRTQLIDITSQFLTNQYTAQVVAYEAALQAGTVTHQQYAEAIKPHTVEQLLQHVEKLYNFVRGK